MTCFSSVPLGLLLAARLLFFPLLPSYIGRRARDIYAKKNFLELVNNSWYTPRAREKQTIKIFSALVERQWWLQNCDGGATNVCRRETRKQGAILMYAIVSREPSKKRTSNLRARVCVSFFLPPSTYTSVNIIIFLRGFSHFSYQPRRDYKFEPCAQLDRTRSISLHLAAWIIFFFSRVDIEEILARSGE